MALVSLSLTFYAVHEGTHVFPATAVCTEPGRHKYLINKPITRGKNASDHLERFQVGLCLWAISNTHPPLVIRHGDFCPIDSQNGASVIKF